MRWRLFTFVLLLLTFGGWHFLTRDVSSFQAATSTTSLTSLLPQGLLPANPDAKILLGALIFFDPGLSSPAGQSCGSCHALRAGWTFPNSNINQLLGPVPGVVPGRFGNRKPPTVSYASFGPTGPTFNGKRYVGGIFWDGRATSLSDQIHFPLTNPNEMNNASTDQVAQNIPTRPYAFLFEQVYPGAFAPPLNTTAVFADLVDAVTAFENAPVVSPFSSKYDAYLLGRAGTKVNGQIVTLTASEANGLALFTGTNPDGTAFTPNAGCSGCHVAAQAPGDLFTDFGFRSTGVPKNPNNPYYTETNSTTNPKGYNPLGAAFVDYGLGGFIYPSMGLPSGNIGTGASSAGDLINGVSINGTFKTPTVRNVDKRPYPAFVKDFNHNGVFKSLAQVVHFYNMRNLTTMSATNGEVINFNNVNPYAGLVGTPLFPPPEYVAYPNQAALGNTGTTLLQVTINDPAGTPGKVGNLGLTASQEADLVNFMTTLSDGYFIPGAP